MPALRRVLVRTRPHRDGYRGADWRREALRTNLWLVPSLESLLAIALWAGTVALDRAAYNGHLSFPAWVLAGRAHHHPARISAECLVETVPQLQARHSLPQPEQVRTGRATVTRLPAHWCPGEHCEQFHLLPLCLLHCRSQRLQAAQRSVDAHHDPADRHHDHPLTLST